MKIKTSRNSKPKVYPERRRRVFVAMSGGVDSSVAAALLKTQGYEVIGAHMKCFNVDGCAANDAEDARRVSETLGIPFYVFDFEEEYKARVVNYMIDGYKRGFTPNPDVECNREIKFGLFLKKALEMGADYVATGHYVRLGTRKQELGTSKIKSYQLLVARDKNKDQSYFLWTLTQDQLKYCLFPIGDYLKLQVRKTAREFGLHNALKKDSQGICFLGKVTLRDFLGNYIPSRRGEVVSTSGAVLGKHSGAQFYTVGQRHIGLATSHWPIANSNRKPFYVAEKNIKTNTITVAEGDDNPALYKNEIKITNVNFIDSTVNSLIRANGGIIVYTRMRYRQPLFKANLKLINLQTYKLIFAEPQKFVAPGQSTVFYSKSGEMLGGGVILG